MKHVRAKWKMLSKQEEKNIVKDYDEGILRNEIYRLYGITEEQLIDIIKKDSIMAKLV